MNKFLNKNINKIITIFILIQPILDVISGFNNNILKFNISPNVIFRILFLVCSIFYLLFINKTKYKKISLYYLLGLFIYFILFSISIIHFKGFDCLFYEIKNLVLSFYFPILLVTFINLFDQYNIRIDLKYLFYTFIIYLIFIFIPNITGLSFDSYTQGKVGNSGWFNSANAISSILSILLPFIIIYLKNKKFNFKYLILIAIFLYCILSLGTKVPLLSLGIILIFNIIYLIYYLLKKKDYKKISIIITSCLVTIIGLIIIIPHTSFYKNIEIHLDFLGIDSVEELITDINMIDRFIFSDRLTFLMKTKNVYDSSSLYEKLIGIGYIENYGTDLANTKMVEMDYYDIFYRHGIVGCILFFIPILLVLFKSVKNFDKLDFNKINIITSIALVFILAFFSGHIFTVPNVSVFIVIILSMIIYRNNNELY